MDFLLLSTRVGLNALNTQTGSVEIGIEMLPDFIVERDEKFTLNISSNHTRVVVANSSMVNIVIMNDDGKL